MSSDPGGGSLGVDNMYLGVPDTVTPGNTFGSIRSVLISGCVPSDTSVRLMS